jgi:hypothetical protein
MTCLSNSLSDSILKPLNNIMIYQEDIISCLRKKKKPARERGSITGASPLRLLGKFFDKGADDIWSL